MHEDKSPEVLKEIMLSKLPNDMAKGLGSFADIMLSPVAYELWKYYDSLNSLIPMAFVNETSGQYIEKRAAEFGLYPKPGKAATVVLTFSGMAGTEVPKGYSVSTENGLEFVTAAAVVVGPDNSCTVEAASAEIGAKYNVPAGVITKTAQGLNGIVGVTNKAAALGGQVKETDVELLERLNAKRQKPATSGNINNYEQWALSVSGVGSVRVVPLWNGPGTVKVIIAAANKQPVSKSVVDACFLHINSERPVGAAVTVVSATTTLINVAATVVLEKGAVVSQVKSQFAAAITKMFEDISLNGTSVVYNRVAYLLLSVAGVTDFTSLAINGGTGNITIPPDAVPLLNSVEVVSA